MSSEGSREGGGHRMKTQKRGRHDGGEHLFGRASLRRIKSTLLPWERRTDVGWIAVDGDGGEAEVHEHVSHNEEHEVSRRERRWKPRSVLEKFTSASLFN